MLTEDPSPRSSRTPGRALVGCSGWSYRDWRGAFYPTELPKHEWFSYYASRFDTVEINSSFYRLPDSSTVRAWAELAPTGFVYAVKLGRFGSHRKKLREPTAWLGNHVDRISDLGRSLGPTLVQLPPRWHRDTARLDEFLEAAPRSMRWAVEFRDPSWLHDDVFSVLSRHRVALCVHDLLPDHPFEMTAEWTYLRFHGPHASTNPYRERYTGRRLWRVADRLAGILEGGHDVFAYFNNDVGASAPADAGWLRDRLAGPVAGSPSQLPS